MLQQKQPQPRTFYLSLFMANGFCDTFSHASPLLTADSSRDMHDKIAEVIRRNTYFVAYTIKPYDAWHRHRVYIGTAITKIPSRDKRLRECMKAMGSRVAIQPREGSLLPLPINSEVLDPITFERTHTYRISGLIKDAGLQVVVSDDRPRIVSSKKPTFAVTVYKYGELLSVLEFGGAR